MKNNVLFLCHDEVTWNCYNKLYHEMLKSEDFNPIVVTFPVSFDTSNKLESQGFKSDYDIIQHKLLMEKNINHIRLNEINLNDRIDFIKNLNSSFIITSKMYDNYYYHGIGIHLKQFAELFKLVYIPYYGATITTDDVAHCLVDEHKHCWKLIADSDVYKSYFINCGIDENKIISVGHPKIQEIFNIRNIKGIWPLPHDNNTLKVIWAPHWSLVEFEDWTNGRKNTLKFGTFTKNCDQFYEFAKSHCEIQIVLKPHPLLQFWMKMHNIENIFFDFIKKWTSLNNTYLMMDGLYNELFAASDIMITDGCSFLTEYPIATGKPLIYIDSGVHDEFNEIGKLAQDYSHVVTTFEEISNYLLGIKKFRTDNNIDSILNYLLPYRENTTKILLEKLKESFEYGI